MIGVRVGRAVLEAAGDGLGEDVGAGRGGVRMLAEFTAGDAGVGAAGPLEAEPRVIAPAFHICPRFEEFISNSIGMRRGFAGCGGSAICLPLIMSCADWASDFA